MFKISLKKERRAAAKAKKGARPRRREERNFIYIAWKATTENNLQVFHFSFLEREDEVS